MAQRAQIIPPRNDLKRKAVNHLKGFDLTLPPRVLAKLEEVVHRSRDKFTVDIARRLTDIRDACQRIELGDMALDRFIDFVREESLQIKGAGGTIGYHLLSQIGHLLGEFMKDRKGLDAIQMDVLKLHVDALYVVLAQRITGQGDELERQVVNALSTAVAKYK